LVVHGSLRREVQENFDRAFSDMTRARAAALTVLSTPMFASERSHVVALAAKNRLPAVYPLRKFVDAGGLMAYGPDLADLLRRVATYVHKILKGTKPGAEMAADLVRQHVDVLVASSQAAALAAGRGGPGVGGDARRPVRSVPATTKIVMK
jgi:ABC-type uncharacterized transport system substrate-binding protein